MPKYKKRIYPGYGNAGWLKNISMKTARIIFLVHGLEKDNRLRKEEGDNR